MRTITVLLLFLAVTAAVGQETPPSTPAPAAAAPATTPTPTPPLPPTNIQATVDACSQCKGPYCPTVMQCKDLTIDQKDAVIAFQAYNARLAQEEVKWDEYKQRLVATQRIVERCRKVMDDNKWPKEVRCDPNTNPVVFVIPSAAPAPAAKPAPAAETTTPRHSPPPSSEQSKPTPKVKLPPRLVPKQ